MNEGMIKLDSEFAKGIGFTSDKFGGYLWAHPGEIYISFIESRAQGKGNLSKLFDEIWKRGLRIKVPTPFPRMEAILKHKGFQQTWEYSDVAEEDVEIWVKDADD